MAEILHEFTVAVPPAQAYRALTEQHGLSSWWTLHTVAQPKIDSIAEFRFEEGNVVFRMRIDKLEPNSRVQWSVQDPAEPGWERTHVTWDLTPVESGTRVLFGHRGWASTGGSFPSINYAWGSYLSSLKAYLETHQGSPYSDPA